MPKLTIVAHVHAKSGKEDFVKGELLKLIPITRAEEGCLQYDLPQDKENPAHFVFYENWVSLELWQNHMNAPHLTAYMDITDGAIADFTLCEMNHIS